MFSIVLSICFVLGNIPSVHYPIPKNHRRQRTLYDLRKNKIQQTSGKRSFFVCVAFEEFKHTHTHMQIQTILPPKHNLFFWGVIVQLESLTIWLAFFFELIVFFLYRFYRTYVHLIWPYTIIQFTHFGKKMNRNWYSCVCAAAKDVR